MGKDNSEFFNELVLKTNDNVSKLSENLYKPENPDVLKTDIRKETPEEREERHKRNDYTPEYNAAVQRINSAGERFYGRTKAKGLKLTEALSSAGFLSREAKDFIDNAIDGRNDIEHTDKKIEENESRKVVGKKAYEQVKKVADEIEKISNGVLGTVGSIDNLIK